MKRELGYHLLYLLIALFIGLYLSTTYAQESNVSTRNKSVFVEFGGSSATIVSGNFDMRFNKGRADGLGVRVGIGGGAIKEDYVLGEGSKKTKTLTVPVEVNYILGERRFSFEIGCSVTYMSITEDSSYRLFDEYYESNESENLIVSYVPIGFRWKPKHNGFLLKLNVGPIFNYSAPNLASDESVGIFGGLALGYSFY